MRRATDEGGYNMEKYEELEIEVIVFESADVITGSSDGNTETGVIDG